MVGLNPREAARRKLESQRRRATEKDKTWRNTVENSSKTSRRKYRLGVKLNREWMRGAPEFSGDGSRWK